MKLEVTYDDKRCGYWVRGFGFDFFAYFTSDFSEDTQFIECDYVQRAGEDYSTHIRFPIKAAGGEQAIELVETLMYRELSQLWDLKIHAA